MNKKVAISQSNYIPWKGYFDSMKKVDVFVLYDDMQYTKRDWRNRNRIKTKEGLKWLTIPVEVKGKFEQKIKDVKISDPNWNQKHWKILFNTYKKAEGFGEVKDFIEDLYLKADFQYLSEVNFHFLKNISTYLEIDVDFRWSSDFDLAEDRNERLIGICEQLNATDYYSGPAAKAYMDISKFKQKGIEVHFYDYSGYEPYKQINPPFEHGVSILDLLFNAGNDSKKYLKMNSKVKSHED